MGIERGSHAATTGAQSNGYQRSYHRSGYRSDRWGDSKFGMYDKYNDSKFDRSEATNGGYQNGKSTPAGAVTPQSGAAQTATQSGFKDQKEAVTTIAGLEQMLAATQTEMNQALQDTTSKEKEKFDLIFSILTELQNRQGKLEESLKSLKAQFEPMNGGCQPLMAQPMSPANGQTSPAAQVVIAPQMGMMNGQMGMNQQMMGNMMMMSDGSMAPVMVAMPQQNGQMQFMTQMVPQGMTMQAMPQQMVQFVAGQGGDGNNDFQYMQNMMNTGGMGGDGSSTNTPSTTTGGSSGSSPDTERSNGEQQSESAVQDSAADAEQCKVDLRIHEEE
eukprot:TRINITY_DN77950_c0_g1_i1.p1 TRINITY_DN77950_c0_g1~~TRINITY_DN77950_c0_g1_i1.p1  ORF type:complete len:348 (+),score=107.49 TRINITY_DN77950_c0_g1_i1:57-1046(+)